MAKNEIIWILPNRNQNDEDTVLKNGERLKLTSAINVVDLPKSIILGIPEGILKRNPDKDLIYAQYCRQQNPNRDIFVLSVKCGVDKDNRGVYLTVLQILNPGADPGKMPEPPIGLNDEERTIVQQISQRYQKNQDKWIKSIKQMLDYVASDSDESSFANIENPDAVFRAQWTPLSTKSSWVRIVIISAVIVTGLCYLVKCLMDGKLF